MVEGKEVILVKGYRLPVILDEYWNLIFSIVIIGNNTVLYD